MSRCTQCRTLLQPGTRFCPQCGAENASPSACPECGHPTSPNQAFCGECGSPLAGQAAPTPAPASRPPTKAPHARLSRWRPQSTFGCGLYVGLVGGAALLGYSLAQREQITDGQEWLAAGGFVLSVLMLLTFWRNVLISIGALSPKQGVDNVASPSRAAGGINWWNLIGILIVLALVKIGGELIKKLVLAPRPPTGVKSPDVPRLQPVPYGARPPTPIRSGKSDVGF